ncbi:MAG: class III signal peptide-containing protein [Candidatus Diapherotrites archaeon]|nr:class III signal peptide-containing protein [Candidatus Diapherotrites archaeon]
MVLDCKAQISLEMILVLAALIVVALLVVSKLQSVASKASKTIDKRSEDLFEVIDDIGKT